MPLYIRCFNSKISLKKHKCTFPVSPHHTFICNFCKVFTRHVLIDSKGLGCPGQEAVPPQESDSKSAPSLVSGAQELRSLHESGCDVLSRGRGAIKTWTRCVLYWHFAVTLSSFSALRSLFSDYYQGLVILDQIRLSLRDLHAALTAQCLQGRGWLQ